MQYHVRNVVLLNVLDTASGLGLDPDQILARLQFSNREQLLRPNAFIPTSVIIDAVEYGALLGRRPDFGMMVGQRADYRTFGAFGTMLSPRSTGREIIQDVFRFAALLNSGTELSLHQSGNEAFARFRVLTPSTLPPRQYTECQMLVVLNFMRLLFGDAWSPLRVSFRHAHMSAARIYQKTFRCDPGFGQAVDEIVLSVADLDRRMNLAETPLEPMVRRLLEESPQRRGDDLGRAIAGLLPPLLASQKASVEHVAPLLGLSPRTLQRRLNDEGLSFRQIVQETRVELATDHFSRGPVSGAALARILGFSDATAVSRFLRANGLSARQRAGAA